MVWVLVFQYLLLSSAFSADGLFPATTETPICLASDKTGLQGFLQRTCEIEINTKCRETYKNAPGSLIEPPSKVCEERYKEATSAVGVTVACSSVALFASIQIAAKMQPALLEGLAKMTPAAAQRFFARYGGVIRGANYLLMAGVVLYKGPAAISADKECFENVEQKKLKLETLISLSESLAARVSERSPNLEAQKINDLKMRREYLESDFVKNVSCTRIRELEVELDKRQSVVLGPLLANGAFSIDPRLDFALTAEQQENLKKLLDNQSCLSPQKSIELMCAVGNAALGGRALTKLYQEAKNSVQVARDYNPFRMGPYAKKFGGDGVSRAYLPPRERTSSLGVSPKLDPSNELKDVVYHIAGETHSVKFFRDPTSGLRYEKISITPSEKINIFPKPNAANAVRYPAFQEKMGVKVLPDGRTVVRPADASAHNDHIKAYNKTVPDEEKIPIKVKDDFSKNGLTSEEVVDDWAKEGAVFLNRVNVNLHNHDNHFHIDQFEQMTVLVMDRSRHNIGLMSDLLKSDLFKPNLTLRAHVFHKLAETIDGQTGWNNWNRGIPDAEEMKALMLKIGPLTSNQMKALENTFKRFKPRLTPDEIAHQRAIVDRRIGEPSPPPTE